MLVCDRQPHRHLAVVGLAEPTAVLPGYTDRMYPLLRKAGVIYDPVTGLTRTCCMEWRLGCTATRPTEARAM